MERTQTTSGHFGSYTIAAEEARKCGLLPILFLAMNTDDEEAFYAGNKTVLETVAEKALKVAGVGRIRFQPFVCCGIIESGEEPPDDASLRDVTLMMGYPLWIVAVDPPAGQNVGKQAADFKEVVRVVKEAWMNSKVRRVAIGPVRQSG